MKQKSLFDDLEADAGSEVREQRSGSFVDNMQLPIHRWFRYSAGFSAEWAGQLIRGSTIAGRLRVFDPFVGSGTVVLEAERANMEGIGVEAHPFVARIARAKLHWREDAKVFRRRGVGIARAAERDGGSPEGYAALAAKCYPPETLAKLDALKNAWIKANDGTPVAELCWLTLVSILRAASPVGTAQWQYVLPRKSKAKFVEPFAAFEERVGVLAADMFAWREHAAAPRAKVCVRTPEPARACRTGGRTWF